MMIKNLIRKLNSFEPTRELIMIPIIYIRDKYRDLHSWKFISDHRRELRGFKDIHKGQRCFIIGNGPSLSPEDLNLIKDEFSFASNRIYDLYLQTQWRPTYYAVQDIYVLEEISKEIELLENGAKARFLISNRKKIMCSKMINNEKNHFFYLGTCLSENRRIKFCTDITKTISNGRTITYAMIQIARYMGFSEIYLLGVDHNYGQYIDQNGILDTNKHASFHFMGARPYKQLHACNVDDSKKGILHVSTKAYQTAEEFSHKNNFRIMNATRGGKLQVFERINLEEVIHTKL